jgi:molybdopterin synthase catalytic subunit
MKVEVRETPFDPWAELGRYEVTMRSAPGRHGATAVFVGTMRDFNEGARVRAMTLEHYTGMTERHLEGICREACARWPILDTLILHRTGEVQPGDPIVLVAVWSEHRGAAFEACRFLIEDLKSRAPFWKKEVLETGARWVDKNTAG